MSVTLPRTASPSNPIQWMLPVLAGGVLIWSFLPTFNFMLDRWIHDPQYSHGFLVPLFSLFLLRRSGLKFGTPRPGFAVAILAMILSVRWLAGGMMFHQLDAAALLVSIAALVLAFGGWPLLRVSAPAIAFLIFMIPLPYELEQNVGGPLKVVATQGSTYLLQTLGQPAIAEGNLILIDEVRLGVVDACSGLKMLMTFSAFAVGAVLLTDRTRFEKLLVLLGIVPIAVITNVLRITATGVAHTLTENKDTLNFIHDLNGWLMMPLGLGLLAWQLHALSRLVIRPNTNVLPAPVHFAPLRPAMG